MHRVLAAQLRILLCDNTSKPLLRRLFPNLRLQRLEKPIRCEPGRFPANLSHLNDLCIEAPYPVWITCMPFEADMFHNGVEDCRPIVAESGDLLPIDEWVEQIVTTYPVTISIRQVIRTVADRGGGSHVHKSKDALLFGLREPGPTKMTQAALVLVAVSKLLQFVGQSIVQLYERSGPSGSIPVEPFDKSHPFVQNAARVPDDCLTKAKQCFTLLNVSRD